MKKARKPISDWEKHRHEFLRNALREASIRWPAFQTAKEAARVAQRLNPSTNRKCWYSRCAGCGIERPEKQFAVDHVEPVVAIERDYTESAYSPAQLGELAVRLLPRPEGLQILCFSCHSQKTEAEERERGQRRGSKLKGSSRSSWTRTTS